MIVNCFAKFSTHKKRVLFVIPILAILAMLLVSTASAGTNQWTSIGPDGGYMLDLAIDPATPTTVYAAGNAGIFKSMDGGESWKRAFASSDTHYSSIAIDPKTPTTLYSASGLLVYKSVNSGDSWSAVTVGLDVGLVYVVEVNPVTPSIIYAGTAKGVYKSSNGGGSWTAANTGISDKTISAIAIDPNYPENIYVVDGDGGIFKSTNSGVSWSATNNGLESRRIKALAIDPVISTTLFVGDDAAGGIFKSIDAGASWSQVNDGLPIIYLAIDPNTPSTIYAGTYYSGIIKSVDGGDTWSSVNNGLGDVRINGIFVDPETSSTVYALNFDVAVVKSSDGGENWSPVNQGLHAMAVSSLAIDPKTPYTLYAGTTNGVYRSIDGGENWSSADTGIEGEWVLALAIDPVTTTTLYAVTSGHGIFKSSNSGDSWDPINNGVDNLEIRALAIDPSTPSTLYAGARNAGGLYKSSDGGANWSNSGSGLGDQWIISLAINPVTPSTIYAGTSNGVYKSIDSGATWKPVNSGMFFDTGRNRYILINDISIESGNSAIIYAGTDGRGVYKSTNSGASWRASNDGLPGGITSLAIKPGATATVYAPAFGLFEWKGVYKTTNGGVSWSADNTGLYHKDVRCIAIDPLHPSITYVGTGGGVYVSVLDDIRPVNGTLTATQLEDNQIQIDWDGFSDADTGIASYRLVRGTILPLTCLGTTVATPAADATTYTDSGTQGTTYYYRLCAVDSAGNVSSGATVKVRAIPELTKPTGTVVINGDASYTNKAAVTLKVDASDTSKIAAYCISNTDTCTLWTAVTAVNPLAIAAKAWTLASGANGNRTVKAWFRDIWGNVSDPASDSITLDVTAPGNGTLTATQQEGNLVQLDWSGFTEADNSIVSYRLVRSTLLPATCLGATVATPAADATTYTDSGTQGATYYYRLCAVDSAGNVSSGATVKVRAIPELAKPTGTVVINGDASYTNKAAVTLKVDASDTSKIAAYCISNTDTCTLWTAVTAVNPLAIAAKAWTLASGANGSRTVKVWYRDVWGNVSDPASDTITLDVTAPGNGTLTATQQEGNLVQLDWSGFTEADNSIVSYRLVRSTLLPATCLGATVATPAADATTYTDSGTQGATYYYRLCAVDSAGNVSSGTTVKVRAIPELAKPTGTVVINGDASYTNKAAVTLKVDASDTSKIAAYCISNTDTCTTWTAVTAVNPLAIAAKAWTLASGANGSRTVKVWYRDVWGNVSDPASDTITLDVTAPGNGTLTATQQEGNLVQLDWSGFTEADNSIVSYRLVRGTTQPATCLGATVATPAADAATYTDSGTQGATYYYRLCAVDSAGNVSSGTTATLKVMSEMKIYAGYYHSMALKTDGTVWAWGNNSDGQLGDGTTTSRTAPVKVKGLSNIIDISTGDNTPIVLKADGTVWWWGRDWRNVPISGKPPISTIPAQLAGISQVSAISSGHSHGVALKADGTVWWWRGYIPHTPVPTQIGDLSGVKAVTSEYALKTDGTVWRLNFVSPPTQVVNISDIKSLMQLGAALEGSYNQYAVKSDGSIWKLGETPTQITNLNGLTVISESLGIDTLPNPTVAVKSDGTVWNWADNGIPLQINELAGIVTASVGYRHALALESDGSVWSWGSNTDGILGDGTTTASNIPVQVTGLVLK